MIVTQPSKISLSTKFKVLKTLLVRVNPLNIRRVFRRLQEARCLVMDFDGVHTTNTALINFQGEEFVSVNRSDGLGLNILKENNFQMLILSKESNRVVSARAEKLGIPCIQGVEDKLPELIKWLNKVQITPHEVIYLGNDLNDMDCLRASGLSVVVADAYPQAKRVSTLVLRKNGGDGAIRELCDLVSLSRSFG